MHSFIIYIAYFQQLLCALNSIYALCALQINHSNRCMHPYISTYLHMIIYIYKDGSFSSIPPAASCRKQISHKIHTFITYAHTHTHKYRRRHSWHLLHIFRNPFATRLTGSRPKCQYRKRWNVHLAHKQKTKTWKIKHLTKVELLSECILFKWKSWSKSWSRRL